MATPEEVARGLIAGPPPAPIPINLDPAQAVDNGMTMLPTEGAALPPGWTLRPDTGPAPTGPKLEHQGYFSRQAPAAAPTVPGAPLPAWDSNEGRLAESLSRATGGITPGAAPPPGGDMTMLPPDMRGGGRPMVVQSEPRRPLGGGYGIAPRQTPMGVFAGGTLYPGSLDEARSEIETARLQGRISNEKAAELEKNLASRMGAWGESPWGQTAGIIRRQEEGNQERGALQEGLFGQEATAAEAQAERMRALQQQQAKAWNVHRERIKALEGARDKQMAKYQQAVADLQNSEVNPRRAMEGSRGAVAAIAVALGALGAALAKTPNWAAEIVQRNIDNDIRAQEATLANKRGALAAQESMLGQLRAQIGDEHAAREAYRGFLTEQHMRWTEEQAARTGSKFAMARAAEINSKLREGLDVTERNLKLSATQFALEEERQKRAAAAAAAQAAANQDKLAAMRAAGIRRENLTPDLGKLYMPYLGGFAPDAESMHKLADKATALKDLEDVQMELLALQDHPDVKIPGTAAYARAQALQSDVLPRANVARGQGAMAEGEKELVVQGLPSGTELGTTTAKERIAQTLAITRRNRQNLARQNNVRPGVQRYELDERGKERGYAYFYTPSDSLEADADQRAQELAGRK